MMALLKSPYIIILVWLAFMYFVGQADVFKEHVVIYGESKVRYKWWFAFLVFFPVIYFAATRGDVADTPLYKATYMGMPSGLIAGIKAGLEMKKDQGFYVFTGILRAFLGDHYVWYFFIIALIQGISLVSIYRKYSTSFFTSIFLFIVSSDYYSWMFNGIRQFTAVVIILAATDWLIRRKFIRYILVVIFASFMHKSALIMIPIAFIVQGRAWNKRTLIAIFFAILAVIYANQFTDFLNDALQETQYSTVVNDWNEFQDTGTNIIRVAVYSVPALLSIIGYKTIRDEGDDLINICTNMAILTAGIYSVSSYTSGIYVGRLPIYCSLYNYILLPWEIKHMFTRRSASTVNMLMILAYLALYYYQMHVAWGVF